MLHSSSWLKSGVICLQSSIWLITLPRLDGPARFSVWEKISLVRRDGGNSITAPSFRSGGKDVGQRTYRNSRTCPSVLPAPVGGFWLILLEIVEQGRTAAPGAGYRSGCPRRWRYWGEEDEKKGRKEHCHEAFKWLLGGYRFLFVFVCVLVMGKWSLGSNLSRFFMESFPDSRSAIGFRNRRWLRNWYRLRNQFWSQPWNKIQFWNLHENRLLWSYDCIDRRQEPKFICKRSILMKFLGCLQLLISISELIAINEPIPILNPIAINGPIPIPEPILTPESESTPELAPTSQSIPELELVTKLISKTKFKLFPESESESAEESTPTSESIPKMEGNWNWFRKRN